MDDPADDAPLGGSSEPVGSTGPGKRPLPGAGRPARGKRPKVAQAGVELGDAGGDRSGGDGETAEMDESDGLGVTDAEPAGKTIVVPGTLFADVPLSMLLNDGAASGAGARVALVARTGSKHRWTLLEDGDGIWRLSPLLEGRDASEAGHKEPKLTGKGSLRDGNSSAFCKVRLELFVPSGDTKELPLLLSVRHAPAPGVKGKTAVSAVLAKLMARPTSLLESVWAKHAAYLTLERGRSAGRMGAAKEAQTAAGVIKKLPPNTGFRYADVPLSLLCPGADAGKQVEVVSCLSDGNLWTRLVNGDEYWRLWPLLEDHGMSKGGRVSLTRARASLLRNCGHRAVLVELVVHAHGGPLVAGLPNHERLPLLLCAKPSESEESVADAAAVADVHIDYFTAAIEAFRTSEERSKAAEQDVSDPEIAHEDEPGAAEADDMRHAPPAGHPPRFKEALHRTSEALLRALLAANFFETREGSPPRWKGLDVALRALRVIDEADVERHARAVGADADALRLLPRHVMGEAYELLCAHAMVQLGEFQLRDYLAAEAASFLSVRVERVWISAAPTCSRFRFDAACDGDALRVALEAQAGDDQVRLSAARKLAAMLSKHMQRDHAFDLLVWLRDDGGRNHFFLGQCKARRKVDAAVDASRYAVTALNIAEVAGLLGSLTPLMWCSTVAAHAQLQPAARVARRASTSESDDEVADDDAAMSSLMAAGKLRVWLLREAAADDVASKLGERVLEALQQAVAGERPSCVELRPIKLKLHQAAGCDNLAEVRRRVAVRLVISEPEANVSLSLVLRTRVTVNVGTGGGKTYLSCEDVLRFDAERAAAGLPPLPSLLMAPGIDLVLQNAKEHQMYERSTRGAAARPFFYVVCSAAESSAPCANVRIIPVRALGPELDRHAEAGTLGLCRFFTTYEGGGAFWVAARRHALGRGLGPLDPVFGAFVRDEVHRACGADTAFSSGLNVPAVWSAGYTATEAIHKKRWDAVAREIDEAADDVRAKDSPADDGSGSESEDSDAESSGSESGAEEDQERLIHKNPAKIWVQAFGVDAPALKAAARADPAAANRAFWRNLPLLSRELWFEALPLGGKVVLAGAGLGVRLAAALAHQRGNANARPLALFFVEPSPCHAERWDAVYNSSSKEFEIVARYVPPGMNRARVEEYDVLGLQVERDERGQLLLPPGPPRFCARLGPARGLAVHDCSAFDPERNLVGPVVYDFGFAKCFEAGCLAPARFAYLRRDPLAVPAGDEALRREVERWMGVADAAPEDGADGAQVRVQDPSKFFYDLKRVGRAGIGATAHEFWSMSQLLDMMDPSEGGTLGEGAAPVKKAIVFTGHSNKLARRCLRVFLALLELRRDRHLAAGRVERAALLESLFAAHVHHDLAYEERQRRIWLFRDAPCGVLFNVNLLSTGVDIPCVDCVYLLRPSINSDVILQRFGRALRLDPAAPDKVATLAAACVNPYQLEGLRAEGLLPLPPRAADIDERYDLISAAAEAMMDPALRSLGRAFFDAGGGRRLTSGGAVEGEGEEGAEPHAGNSRPRSASSQLQLLVAQRGVEGAQALELSVEDTLLLQDIFRACGRRLLSRATAWQIKLEGLRAYIATHGVLPRQKHPILGFWVTTQRYQYNAHKLDDLKTAALEALGKIWTWQGADYDAIWLAYLEELRLYVETHDALPSRTHPRLNTWIVTQRSAYWARQEGRPCDTVMNDEREAGLETIKHWTWNAADYDGTWRTNLTLLKAYIAEHKGKLPNQRSSLGKWVNNQRTARAALLAGKDKSNLMNDERVAALEALGPVWTWDGAAYDAKFLEKLELLKSYVAVHKRLPLASDDAKLARWIRYQRLAHAAWKAGDTFRVKMDSEREAELEAIGNGKIWKWEMPGKGRSRR